MTIPFPPAEERAIIRHQGRQRTTSHREGLPLADQIVRLSKEDRAGWLVLQAFVQKRLNKIDGLPSNTAISFILGDDEW